MIAVSALRSSTRPGPCTQKIILSNTDAILDLQTIEDVSNMRLGLFKVFVWYGRHTHD